jgi:hypothetical protein
MSNETEKNQELKNIKIENELYRRVRDYCDYNSIRFKDFIEDALENAQYIDESNKILRNEIVELKKKATSYEYAFRRGFERGFIFLFMSFQSKYDHTLKKDEIDILKNNPYKSSRGTQLAIFEDDL